MEAPARPASLPALGGREGQYCRGKHLKQEQVSQSNITRVLAIGFALVILFLSVGGSVAFRSVISIRDDFASLVREQNLNRRLTEELLKLRGDPRAIAEELRRLEADFPPRPEDRAQWDRLLRAESPEAIRGEISNLLAAGFARISLTESVIGYKVGAFTGQSAALLFASVGLALVCSIFTIHATRRIFRNMAWQESELSRVSWQMLADQESIAQRFSHELHDELGQTLAAIRANLTATIGDSRLSDTTALTDDAIRSVRQLSQLLRPTILDDFGLEAGLHWLCEGFMQRTGIDVLYRSETCTSIGDQSETHLFRIAQEALTNVARHSGATQVTVQLKVVADRIRLSIADNGCGIPAGEPRPGFGMTGMRARARVAGGEFRTLHTPGGGLTIEVLIPRASPS